MGLADIGFVDRLREFSARLDDLQAEHPLAYNAVTGVLIGLLAVAFGFAWWFLVLYALSWTVIRMLLWRDGGVLRRQYEARKVRARASAEQQRRERGA